MNRAIWQRRFSILSVNREGEWCCQVLSYVLTSPKRMTPLKISKKNLSIPPLTSKIPSAHLLICNTVSIQADVIYFPKQRKHVSSISLQLPFAPNVVWIRRPPPTILFSPPPLSSYRKSRREVAFLRRVHTFAPHPQSLRGSTRGWFSSAAKYSWDTSSSFHFIFMPTLAVVSGTGAYLLE